MEQSLLDKFGGCVKGSISSCNQFFTEITPTFRRIAGRIAAQYGDTADVEDVVQEICLKITVSKLSLIQSLPDTDSAARSYFGVMAANAARDWYRREKSRRSCVTLDDGLDQIRKFCGVDQGLDADFLMSQIEAALPEDRKQRAIFRLYYRQGYSAREIAGIPVVGLTTKGVESLILRLSKSIKENLVNRAGKSAGNAL